MNLSRYDDLLNKRNGTPNLPSPLTKLREECLELALAIEHYQQGRATAIELGTELADVLLTGRGVILSKGEDFLRYVNGQMEFKANRLLQMLLIQDKQNE